MKAESVIKPKKFTIDKVGADAHISFFDNIKKVTKTFDDTAQEVYEYDHLTVVVPYRKGLGAEIELNYVDWLTLARADKIITQPTLEERMDALEEMELERMLGDVEW